MSSFDEKIYIFDTCHKHLSRNEIPCQAVFNKMSLDSIPDQLKDFKKLQKILISKKIIFKKIAVMHGKGELKVVYVIYSLNLQIFAIFCQKLSDEELKNLSYQERCNLLNNNTVLVPRHFQYKVEVFFKKIILDDPLGKTKYYAVQIEFQERGSPHVHSFIWIFNAPNIENEAAYIEFIEKIINPQLPNHLNDLELFE